MLTNDDLKVLQGVIFALEDLEVSSLIINDLVEIYNKCVDIKRKYTENAKRYQKENRRYHNLNSQLSYHRKRGNQAKVKEIKSRLERLRETYD